MFSVRSFFVGDYFFLVLFDQFYPAQQIGNQYRPFLRAEFVQLGRRRFRRRHQRRVFFFRYGFRLRRHHFRQPQHRRRQRVVVHSDARIFHCFGRLPHVFAVQFAVYPGRGLGLLVFHRHEYVHLAAYQSAGRQRADFVFRLAVERRQPQVQVQLFGVQRADFHRYLLVLQRGFAFAEARHGFGHHLLAFGRRRGPEVFRRALWPTQK